MKTPTIEFTTDLSKFRIRTANRETNPQRVKNISNSIKENGFWSTSPIIVNSKFSVIDGQHRLEAAQAVGVGVYYMIQQGIGDTDKDIFEAAARFNMDQKAWGKNDYLTGLANQNNHSYKKLLQFRNDYPEFTLTEAIMFLQNSGSDWVSKEDFSRGNWTMRSYGTAEIWADRIKQLKPYFPKHYRSSNFVRTMIILFEKHSHHFHFNEFMDKVKQRPDMLHPCGDKRSYSEMIERIYNFRRRTDERISIRFL